MAFNREIMLEWFLKNIKSNDLAVYVFRKNVYEYIISNGITLGYLLESMFESNPSKRITLKQIEEIAKNIENVATNLKDTNIRKVIYIKEKII